MLVYCSKGIFGNIECIVLHEMRINTVIKSQMAYII